MAKELNIYQTWLPVREEEEPSHEERLHVTATSINAARNITAIPSAKATALAPGFRFHPSDEELVSYYLKRKVTNKPVRFNAIGEVDIYKIEPWDLAALSWLKSRDQEWYFFSALDRKYTNGGRMNRATDKGYWKATGKDREVKRESQIIAMKKTLVFHNGRAPGGQRTNWVMHEYRLHEEEYERIGSTQVETYVLCRVFHKNNIGPPNGNRYAPFLEEEWNDDVIVVPGMNQIEQGRKIENEEGPLSLSGVNKKRKGGHENGCNSSESSETTTTDLTMATNGAALVELTCDGDLSIPPNCMQVLREMHGEMQKMALQKEAMRLDLVRAQAIIDRISLGKGTLT